MQKKVWRMLRIVKPRLVIDRKALLVELDSLFEGKNPNSEDSAEILELFKNAKAKGWAEINRRFERDNVNSIEIIKAEFTQTCSFVTYLLWSGRSMPEYSTFYL